MDKNIIKKYEVSFFPCFEVIRSEMLLKILQTSQRQPFLGTQPWPLNVRTLDKVTTDRLTSFFS